MAMRKTQKITVKDSLNKIINCLNQR